MKLPTPPNLTADSGRFIGEIADLSTQQWDNKPWRRRLQRKAWVFAGLHTEKWSIGFAIADAGLIGSAFVYVFERENRQCTEQKLMRPLAFAGDFAPSPHRVWQLHNRVQQYRWQAFDNGYQAEFTGKNLSLRLTMEDNSRSVCALNRLIERPFQYTHKNIGLSSKVVLDINGKHHEYESQHGMMDFSLGYPSRHAQWQWACLSGCTAEGITVGINAVAQYFNGLENALWLGDELMPLPQMIFDYQPNDILRPWHIHSTDQRLQITFTPEGLRRENIQLLILASHFQQPFGHFVGQYCDSTGKVHEIKGFGVVEQHRATW